MKKILSLGLGLSLAFSGLAQTLPTYKTIVSTGTTGATNIFPQGATTQVRVVSEIVSSDLASSVISLYSGTTAHYVSVANVTAQTTVNVESTNGITANALVYIQGPSTNGVFSVASVASTSFVTSVAVPWAQSIGQEVEVLSTPMLLGVGVTNNKVYASDGLFVGNYGRVVVVALNGTSACTNATTVHYDATSQ